MSVAVSGYECLKDAFQSCTNDLNPVLRRKKLGLSYRSKQALDMESLRMMNLASFEVGYLSAIAKEDANIVPVIAPTGRGKTNPTESYCHKFSLALDVRFTWKHNMYIGEDVIMHRKNLTGKHHRFEHIVLDEAELVAVPNTARFREFKQTLGSIRDAGLQFWCMFPTVHDLNFKLFDAHGKWAIQCLYRDNDIGKVFFKIFYNAWYMDQFEGGEWIEYPFVGAIFVVDYIPPNSYSAYRNKKEKIYDPNIIEDWHKEKKAWEKAQKKRIRDETQLEYYKQLEVIFAEATDPVEGIIRALNEVEDVKNGDLMNESGLSYPKLKLVIADYTRYKGTVRSDIKEYVLGKRKRLRKHTSA